MICPSCQTANRVGVAFCASCGGRLPVGGAANRKGLAVSALVLGLASVPLIYVFELSALVGLAAVACAVVALLNARRYPMQFGGKVLAMVGGGIGASVVLMYPVWASIVVPARAHAHIAANEKAAVADVRAVVAAEKVYALTNHDYYDTLSCLAHPQKCIPGGEAAGVPILDDARLADTKVRNGYSFTLFLGDGPPATEPDNVSASSAASFAYVAVPVKPGVTGARSFCGDATELVRADSRGGLPREPDGLCPESWPPVE
jgi:hypothetical protein